MADDSKSEIATTSSSSKKTLKKEDFQEYRGILTEEEFKLALDQEGYDDNILRRAKLIKELVDDNFFKISTSQVSRKRKLSLIKRFTVNGGISSLEDYYFVNPSTSSSLLLEHIEKNEFIMLYGHRGSGKTTRIFYLIQHQLVYPAIYISFQSIDKKNFWKSLGLFVLDEVRDRFSDLKENNLDGIIDKTSFQLFFKTINKNIVLFFDEFDLLLGTDTIDEFLDTMRAIKHKVNTGIYSVVIIGPLNILKASNQVLSPFNISFSIMSPYFSPQDCKELFKEFSKNANITLEDGIVDDIFSRTQGHPGLVCFCGKKIQEDLLVNSKLLSLKEWQEYAIFELPRLLPSSWATVGRLEKRARENSSFLINNFLGHEDVEIQIDSKEIADELVSEGVLTKTGTKSYRFPSPLIRTITLGAVVSQNRKLPQKSLIPIQNGDLLVKELMKYLLPLFDRETMQRASKYSYKKNDTSNSDVSNRDLVPEENVYHLELILLMKDWFVGFGWLIDSEFTADLTSKSADIVLTSPTKHRYVLELVAHARDGPVTRSGTVMEHFDRVEKFYSKIKDVKELWVINFTTRKPSNGYVWAESKEVNVIHVYHDLEWTQATVSFSKDEFIDVKLI